MVSTRRSGGAVENIELSFNGKDLKKVIPIAEQRRLQEEEEGSPTDGLLLGSEKSDDEESEVESDSDSEVDDEDVDDDEAVKRKTRTTRRRATNAPTKAKPTTRGASVAKRKAAKTTVSKVKASTKVASSKKTKAKAKATTKATRTTTKTNATSKKDIEPSAKKAIGTTKKEGTPGPKKQERGSSDESIPLLAKKETRGRPRKYPLGPNGRSIVPPPLLKDGEVKKKRGRPRKLLAVEKRKLEGTEDTVLYTTKKFKSGDNIHEVDSVSPESAESESGAPRQRIPSMQGASIQPISAVVPPHHTNTSPNIHKHNINHLLSSDLPPAQGYSQSGYGSRTPTIPSSAPYPQQGAPPPRPLQPSSSSYSSGYSPQYQPYPHQPPPYLQQLPPYPYQQYSQSLHPPYPLGNGPVMLNQPPPQIQGQSFNQQAPPPPPPPPQQQRLPPSRLQPLPPGPPSQEPRGRIPITSIISQKIDTKDLPSLLYDADTTRDDGDEDGEGLDYEEGHDDNDSKHTKRRYHVDRENIKINKRIMSQDTEEVIKMFKKFDDEVLSNPEARKRLLMLGFETRKRYITTFKHYIRFCCRKKIDNFFVTGELMKEFYEEQFALSSSSKPVIRLRKMDPAFSKLQEINYLVYNLPSKEIPNRHVALEYLVYKELGKEPGDDLTLDYEIGGYGGILMKGRRKKRLRKRDQQDDYTIAIYAPDRGRRPNHGTDIGNQTLLVHPSLPPLPSIVRENQEQLQRQREWDQQSQRLQELHQQGSYQRHSPSLASTQPVEPPHASSDSTSPSIPLYPKRITKKNIDEIRRSFAQLCTDINTSLQKAVEVEPAFVSELSAKVNALLDKFDLELNGPRPPRPPPPQTTSSGVPIYDLKPNTYTVYEILDEWHNGTPQAPSIAQRLDQYGEEWIRDEFEYNTFVERRSVVEFVERLSKETKVDIWVIANDCDRYIRDKSILDEFISEIELDVEDLFKRILRYRQRRG